MIYENSLPDCGFCPPNLSSGAYFCMPQNNKGIAGMTFNLNAEHKISERNYINLGISVNEKGFIQEGYVIETDSPTETKTDYKYERKYKCYGINLGHRFDFVSKYKLKLFTENKFGYEKTVLNNEIYNNALYFRSSLGVEYDFSKRFSVKIKGQYNTGLTGYDVKPYSFGALAGLSYKMFL